MYKWKGEDCIYERIICTMELLWNMKFKYYSDKKNCVMLSFEDG